MWDATLTHTHRTSTILQDCPCVARAQSAEGVRAPPARTQLEEAHTGERQQRGNPDLRLGNQ